MGHPNRRTINICNNLLEALNNSENKTLPIKDLIPILESYFPNWKATERSKERTLCRYMNSILLDGINVTIDRGNYKLNDTRTKVTDVLGVSTLDKAFATIGKILMPSLSGVLLTHDMLARFEQGLCIYVNNNREIFNKVLKAFLLRKELLITIKSRKRVKKVAIEPHGLFLWESKWVIAALENKGINYYRINEIEAAYEVEYTFTFNPDVITAVADLLIKEE